MTSPYRNETDALRERKATLEQEAARLREQKQQLDWLAAREAELARELASIEDRLSKGAKRTLPMLDQIRVASPCSAKWDDMLGDERARFCLSCEKDVYNITALSREDAETFLQERAGGDVCVRYYQRADGTIMTSDCAVGVKRKRRKKMIVAAVGAGALALGLGNYERENMVQGKMEMRPPDPMVVPIAVLPAPTTNPVADPYLADNTGRWVAGGLRANPVAETATPTPVTHPRPKQPMKVTR